MTDKIDKKSNLPDRTYHINDPEQLSKNMLKLLEEGGKIFKTYLNRSDGQAGPYSVASEFKQAAQTLSQVSNPWFTDPNRFAEAQNQLMRGYAELWTRSIKRMIGEEVEPVIEPDQSDSRFRDPDWSENPFFDFCKQAYLLTSQWAEDVIDNTQGIDDDTKRKAEFYLKQVESAFSPSNFVFTNPQVMRETLATNADNLVRGMSHLATDLEHSKDLFKITQTDLEAFKVGENLATTPGKIIYQNDIIQLIQYKPSTATVHEIPILFVPPWINKFYILDLVPEKSFIAWVVAHGFTVFTISWINPGKELSHKSFEDYMHEGVFAALDAVIKATNVQQINTLGYCVGGTLLACALAYMAEIGDKRIKSATFLTTQVDFANAGDLKIFVDDNQLASLEEMMTEQGYLDGSRMAAVFNFLRPQDLIWPYVVNNYLLGKKPFPFDLLYWNQDSTRMPAANHMFYLRQFYRDNMLARGEMILSGKRLELSKVKIPIYELATHDDHIAPAESVYNGSQFFGGTVKFVLAGSGHIAGVINPPQKQKYQYWTNRKKMATLETWTSTATEHPGSWWPNWGQWLAHKSGERVPPPRPGGGKLKPIEDAPGSYVKMKA